MFVFRFHAESLWLIPAALAIGFMLWVLWNLQREIRRESRKRSSR